MRMPIINFKRFAYLVAVSSALVFLVTSYVFNSDKLIPVVQKFAASNEEVMAKVGNVKEIELIKKVAVSASESSSSYRMYTFRVDGDKANATVAVRVEQAGTHEQFLITRLDVD